MARIGRGYRYVRVGRDLSSIVDGGWQAAAWRYAGVPNLSPSTVNEWRYDFRGVATLKTVWDYDLPGYVLTWPVQTNAFGNCSCTLEALLVATEEKWWHWRTTLIKNGDPYRQDIFTEQVDQNFAWPFFVYELDPDPPHDPISVLTFNAAAVTYAQETTWPPEDP